MGTRSAPSISGAIDAMRRKGTKMAHISRITLLRRISQHIKSLFSTTPSIQVLFGCKRRRKKKKEGMREEEKEKEEEVRLITPANRKASLTQNLKCQQQKRVDILGSSKCCAVNCLTKKICCTSHSSSERNLL
jgi:hypothetical protein